MCFTKKLEFFHIIIFDEELHFYVFQILDEISQISNFLYQNKWCFCPNKSDEHREFHYQKNMSEVGFEPTHIEVDCDLNAAP